MRYCIISAVMVSIGMTSYSQARWNAPGLEFNQRVSDTSRPILVLSNGLSPSAVLNDSRELICSATDWIEHYPQIAQRVGSNGQLIWNTVRLSNPESPLDQNGGPALILPRIDGGGVYFVFEFWEYKGRDGHAELYASYPQIQFVDAAGNVQWGVDGKRLTNNFVGYRGGAGVLLTTYALDGDIIVYWTWFEEDSSFNQTFATYSQRVDPITGELLWGEAGRKLFDVRPIFALQTREGTVYVGHNDFVACFDAPGQLSWNYPLLSGINPNESIIAGTNDDGDLVVLYSAGQDLRGRLFSADGSTLWVDKVLSTSVKRILPARLMSWTNNRWIFKMGEIGSSVFCLDREGTMLWGDSGVVVSDRILAAMPVDDENVFVAFQKPRKGETFTYDLMLQKVNETGQAVWETGGIKVFENISVNCLILPDSTGGAYLVFDALTQYEPEFRPRGTYMQRVDRDGNFRIITSVEKGQTSPKILRNSSEVYPNPSSDRTTIQLALVDREWESIAQLTIYDILGREVMRFSIDDPSKRVASIQWDGRDDRGGQVAPGVYFYRVSERNNVVLSGKLLRVR